MKKHALILSLLSVSLASNCMENEKSIIITSPDKQKSITITLNQNIKKPIFCTNTFSSAQPPIEIQEKISLMPKIAFSLNNADIQTLRAILIQKDQIQSNKTELFNDLGDPQASMEKKQSIIGDIIKLDSYDINLGNQFNLYLTLENEQLQDDLDNEIKQISKQILEPNTNIGELIKRTTLVIDQLIPRYQKPQAMLQFAENELITNESDQLFTTIKETSQNQINALTQKINNLTMSINELEVALTHLPKK